MDNNYKYACESPHIAFTLTLSNIVIAQCSLREQYKMVTKLLNKYLQNNFKKYEYFIELTKKANIHVHGIIYITDDIEDEPIADIMQLLQIITNNIMIPIKCISTRNHTVTSKKCLLFGEQRVIKEIFDVSGWFNYISKDYGRTKRMFDKLKINNDFIHMKYHNKREGLLTVAPQSSSSNLDCVTYKLEFD